MSDRRVLVNTTLPAPIIAIFFGIFGSFMDLAVGRPGDRRARAAAKRIGAYSYNTTWRGGSPHPLREGH
jgi:hypothetical protein